MAFLALIAACFVFARRFVGQHRRGWATYSAVTGALFFIALAGLSSMNSTFVFTALNALVWVSVMAAKLLIEQRRLSA